MLKLMITLIIGFEILCCNTVNTKEILDKSIREKAARRGYQVLDYSVIKEFENDSISTFFIDLRAKTGDTIVDRLDTLTFYKTMDGILISSPEKKQ